MLLPSGEALTMGTDFPKVGCGSFLVPGLLTTQVRLALGWFQGRLTGELQELAAGPKSFSSSSLGGSCFPRSPSRSLSVL